MSDANKRRSYQVFEKIYYDLLSQYKPILSDSRCKIEFGKELSIIGSTTIFLFNLILKCVVPNWECGKGKGSIKVYMQIGPDYNPTVLVSSQMLQPMKATLWMILSSAVTLFMCLIRDTMIMTVLKVLIPIIYHL